jgi:flavin-binding protein dodecin
VSAQRTSPGAPPKKTAGTPAAEFSRRQSPSLRSIVSIGSPRGPALHAAVASATDAHPPIGNRTAVWQDTVALTGNRWEGAMTVARVTEIISASDKSFDDAVKEGIARASQTIENIKEAWVASQRVVVENGRIVEYRVTLNVTFVLR